MWPPSHPWSAANPSRRAARPTTLPPQPAGARRFVGEEAEPRRVDRRNPAVRRRARWRAVHFRRGQGNIPERGRADIRAADGSGRPASATVQGASARERMGAERLRQQGEPRGARAPRITIRGALGSAPTSGQRRCRGAAPGGSAAVGRVADPAHRRRAGGIDLWKCCRAHGDCACLHRDGRAAQCAAMWTGCGRPRASPEPTALGVTGLLSPADRSRALGRGPTTHLQYVTRPSEATRGFFEARPWLARTWVPTKPRRLRSRAVRVRMRPNADADPRGLRCAPGTAPGASSRAPSRACRAPRGNGSAPPSHARGSRGARRRRSGPPG